MNAEKFFTPEEQDRIQRAVFAAEQKTAGEIVPMLVSFSAHYAEIEMAGMALGLITGTLIAPFVRGPWVWVEMQILWPLAGAALGYFLCRVPAIKRIFLSKDSIAEAVHLRSLAAFTGQGLHHTRAETGILIFVSLLEHRVVVLADRGIHTKVQQGTWDEVVQIVISGLKSGKPCDAFCKAIERCGEILAEHFPRSPDDKDELSNRLVTNE
jgi:putative membrane protein